MAKKSVKLYCSRTGRRLRTKKTSSAGKALASCRHGLKKNGTLKKGYRFAKGGRIVKAKRK